VGLVVIRYSVQSHQQEAAAAVLAQILGLREITEVLAAVAVQVTIIDQEAQVIHHQLVHLKEVMVVTLPVVINQVQEAAEQQEQAPIQYQVEEILGLEEQVLLV
jgi:hypothetical protein